MTAYTFGVVGLGLIGSAIAERLVDQGYGVAGFDIDEAACTAAADAGVDVRPDAASVATISDVVVTSLPTPDAVRAAYTASDGILTADGEFVACDMSTIDPDTTLTIAERAVEVSVSFIDAPISGGPVAAENGTLTLLVGGSADVVRADAVDALFDAVADTRHHVGEIGAGHTAKLVNNVISMANLLVAMEAVSLGVRRGLDGKVLLDALADAGGSSNQFCKRLPRVLNRNFDPGFSVALGRKDLGLALDTARASDHSMPATGLIYQLFTRAVEQGYGEADAAAVVKLFESDEQIEAAGTVDESFAGY